MTFKSQTTSLPFLGNQTHSSLCLAHLALTHSLHSYGIDHDWTLGLGGNQENVANVCELCFALLFSSSFSLTLSFLSFFTFLHQRFEN